MDPWFDLPYFIASALKMLATMTEETSGLRSRAQYICPKMRYDVIDNGRASKSN